MFGEFGDWQCRRRFAKVAGLLLAGLVLLLPVFWMTPQVSQQGALLTLWLGLSFSASKYGLIWTALLFGLLLRLGWARLPTLLLPALLLIGVGAWLNEHVLKPELARPRPDVVYLASAASGPVLADGAAAFYALGDKSVRGGYLRQRLEQVQIPGDSRLRDHWIAETGFSFPSGHAFAAAALCGWFSLWAFCVGRANGVLPLLWIWMLGVAYSRVQLGVHWPQDVFAGALEGMILIVLCYGTLAAWAEKRNGHAAAG